MTRCRHLVLTGKSSESFPENCGAFAAPRVLWAAGHRFFALRIHGYHVPRVEYQADLLVYIIGRDLSAAALMRVYLMDGEIDVHS